MSADGQKAVTLSYDHTARLWDMASGKCLGVMQHGGAVTKAVFSKDSSLLLTASADTVGLLWNCDSTHKPHPLHVFKVKLTSRFQSTLKELSTVHLPRNLSLGLELGRPQHRLM